MTSSYTRIRRGNFEFDKLSNGTYYVIVVGSKRVRSLPESVNDSKAGRGGGIRHISAAGSRWPSRDDRQKAWIPVSAHQLQRPRIEASEEYDKRHAI